MNLTGSYYFLYFVFDYSFSEHVEELRREREKPERSVKERENGEDVD